MKLFQKILKAPALAFKKPPAAASASKEGISPQKDSKQAAAPTHKSQPPSAAKAEKGPPPAFAAKAGPAPSPAPSSAALTSPPPSDESLIKTLKFEVSQALVDKAFAKALSNIQKRASAAGFRQGKAPLPLIKKLYGEEMKQAVVQDLSESHAAKALQKAKLELADTPKLASFYLKEGESAQFEIEAEAHPEVHPKDCLRIPLTKRPVPEPSPKEIQDSLDKLAQRHAAPQPQDLPLTDGLLGTFDLEAFLKGRRYAPLCNKSFPFLMGAPGADPGMSAALKGMRKGQTREFPIHFSKDHEDKKLAGRKIRFKACLKSVNKLQPPAIDDEFAKKYGAKNAAALREEIAQALKEANKREASSQLEYELIKELIKRNPLPLPPSVVAREAERIRSDMAAGAPMRQLPPDMAKSILRGKEKDIERLARFRAHADYLLCAIAVKERLPMAQQEIRRAAKSLYPESSPAEARRLLRSNTEAYQAVQEIARKRTAVEWLLERADITEAPL